ncbi:MAG: molecular chaperone [Selenomonadaceae bacterium]|nr:molecular chaperone [Selenomonadaceae bacterium]
MEQKRYYERDLQRMTVYQLQEIARREKIIPAVVNRLDKELLIKTILLYRGAERALLINEYRADDYQRLEEIFPKITFQAQKTHLEITSIITVWRGLGTDYFDNIRINFTPELIGTNAFITDSEKNLCCVFNVEQRLGDEKYLYLRRNRNFPCHESQVKNYYLIALERVYSEQFFYYYNGRLERIQENIPAHCLQLLDFIVKEPEVLRMPVAIDFGTASTTAGVLDFKQKSGVAEMLSEKIRHAVFYDNGGNETFIIPTLVGVRSLKDYKNPEYAFGYDALELMSYVEKNYTVFYDIKRWIAYGDKEEELTDSDGRRVFIKRKNILREFFIYVIHALEDYIKGKVRSVHFSAPVKQKRIFQKLFQEMLPEYVVEKKEMVDESVAVLYNTISELIEDKKIVNRQKYRALVVDCGGGTTDVSSCSFNVDNRRVAYKIDIETGYENGSTEFGGNNLTYRVLQMLKLKIIESLGKQYETDDGRIRAQHEFYGEKVAFDSQTYMIASTIPKIKNLLQDFNIDVFRYVDDNGVDALYRRFEDAYRRAEDILPTRYKDWENRSRSEYFRVRNNYYFLFALAERIKQEFFNENGFMRVKLAVEGNDITRGRNWEIYRHDGDKIENTITIPLDKWRLTLLKGDELTYIKTLPNIFFNPIEIVPIITPDIYNVVRQLLDPLYESGELEEYNLIKLSGQSCKVSLFRTALKEFVPGKMIKSKPKDELDPDKNERKMACIDGALKYLRDKKFGYADINITNRRPHLPYVLTGFTHAGEEVTLIDDSQSRERGVLSRTIEDLSLRVYLKDNQKNLRQELIYECVLDEFTPKKQEDIEAIYGDNIPQDETDTIINREVNFFIWAEPQDWGFVIVPVYRADETLHVGREQFFNFESEQWLKNFFDGLK